HCKEGISIIKIVVYLIVKRICQCFQRHLNFYDVFFNTRRRRSKREEGEGGASSRPEFVRVARWPVHYHNRIPLSGL
ncbi:unnamed protein product, partial [Heterotrigona itama]